jgi:hypothetical protein
MLVLLLLIWLVVTWFLAPTLLVFTIILFVALAWALLMGIPAAWYNRNLVNAFLQIPSALFSMFKAMLHIGQARKQFIHTPHEEVEQ